MTSYLDMSNMLYDCAIESLTYVIVCRISDISYVVVKSTANALLMNELLRYILSSNIMEVFQYG